MVEQNADPEFVAARRKGQGDWSPQRRAEQAARLKAMCSDPEFVARQREAIANRPRRGVTMPKHVHPLVRGFFAEFNAQQATRDEVGARAGLNRSTFTGWRNHNVPLIDTFDAALNSLDLELAIVPIGTRDANGFAMKGSKR